MPAAIGKLRPSDCVLAFGIPTSEDEFWEAQGDSHRDFVKGQVWEKYDFQFVSHLRKVEPRLLKLGLKVVHKLTLRDFGRLLRDPSNTVVILFSHWAGRTVEFFDGMATEDEIVGVIPSDFDGIVDLTICHPEHLPMRIRNHLPPTSLVKYTDEENTPVVWLYFYWAVFTILDDSHNTGSGDSGVSYLEALERAVEEFKK